MKKKPNRWYAAVLDQLADGATRTPSQIWEGMEAAGFQHASKMPRSTLGARIAELVEDGVLKRTGRRTYQLRKRVVAPTPIEERTIAP